MKLYSFQRRALSYLEDMFVSKPGDTKQAMSLLLIDEIDVLMTKDQSVSAYMCMYMCVGSYPPTQP